MDPLSGGPDKPARSPGRLLGRGGTPGQSVEPSRPPGASDPGGRSAGPGSAPGGLPDLPRRSRTTAPDTPGSSSGPAAKGGPAPRTPLPARASGGQAAGGEPRWTADVISGDYLLTVNPTDGSEVTHCPPAARPEPRRRSPREREEARLARMSPLAGRTGAVPPLLEREQDHERLVRLLTRGRSVRVTGPSGSGRTSLLAAVADSCVDLAPDGVVELSGYRRTPRDLMHALFAAVYDAPGYRPDRPRLLELLRDIGAIVVIDDLEFGGAALEELVWAAPDCAFLLAATPDVAVPSMDSPIEEVFLSGLSRGACMELLQRAVDRPLEDDEKAWAADLWFESEGLPLRFVQAGALLRQRDAERARHAADLVAADSDPFDKGAISEAATGEGTGDTAPYPASLTAPHASVPLPTLAESAAPAKKLAEGLSPAGREALRFAVALGGECPDPSHLPALVGDTHGDTALAELVTAGLAVRVGSHYRLAAGVRAQVAPLEPTGRQALAAARHYAWWAAHPSVPSHRVAAEAEAVLAAMGASRDAGEHSTTVLLARAAAPVFAAALHWSAWERALRLGQEAARVTGEVAEEAYFHHELGVLALCTGNSDRARAELEASIALRGALADRQGTVVGRRTLALITDPTGALAAEETDTSALAETMEQPKAAPGAAADAEQPTIALPMSPAARPAAKDTGDTSVLSSPTAAVPVPDDDDPASTVISPGPASGSLGRDLGRRLRSKRVLAAAGAGVLLAAVLGAVVSLSGGGETGGEPRAPMNVAPVDSEPDDAFPQDGAPPADPSSPSAKPSKSSSKSSSPSGTARPPTPQRPPVTGGQPGRPTTTKPTSKPPSSGQSPSKPPTSGTTTGGSTGTSTGGSTSGSSSGSTTGSTSGSTGSPTSGGSTTGSTTGEPTGGADSGGAGGAGGAGTMSAPATVSGSTAQADATAV